MPISAQTGDVTWHHGHAAKRKALRICSSFPPIATSTVAIRNGPTGDSQWPLNVETSQADGFDPSDTLALAAWLSQRVTFQMVCGRVAWKIGSR